MANLTLNQHANNSEENDSNLEQKLQNWSIPKIRTNQVYKTSIFEFNPDYEIKTVEKSFAVQGPYQRISILDSRIVNQHVRKYRDLHIGLVQLAVKPLTRLRYCDLPILICLRDKRMLRFHESVLAVLECNIQNGPAYFNCFPSYPVCLRDPHVTTCVDLDIKIPNEMFIDGIPPVSIMYRFCYKVTDNLSGIKAVRDYTVNETEVTEINAENSSRITRKILKHDEITYPQEWLQGCSSQPAP
ncbi:uncharacterized protein LOC130718638 [Lotus japonicus]|uniref:uncharacterized protein LOC130718638 n=1 Tax=Lotus japonicus TaxID=34305 RepID=UPI0025851AE8|nr:uncharacterized protein LOC130718638 [Lotus japonicus]